MKKTDIRRSWALWLPCLSLAVALTACTSTRTAKKKGAGADKAQSGDLADGGLASPTDITEASIHHKQFVSTPELQSIRFEYDAYSLSPEARQTLAANAGYLKANPSVEVLVEGHCDERGTVEYNLALGQRRAKEVRDYYLRLGVPGRSVGTISFGEERPSCSESTEDCWSKNRRAETKVRARAASNGLHKKGSGSATP